MIRIRKHDGDWEVRWRIYKGDRRTWHWGKSDNLEDLQQTIIQFAVHMDNYIREALEVLQGKSEYCQYLDGKLIRSKPLQPIVSPMGYRCITMPLRHHAELEETIQFIESGTWRVRKWTPPAIFAGRKEFMFSTEVIKDEYLIVETRDDGFVPFEVIT